ncbi:hypothetical protein BDR07DRAFT_415877 [Suillus spraguei]|nr:hypothetical protein BDR07DRAFT_415877 [Suillus spraguei]
MTIISNDPSWWPTINASICSGYFEVASFIVVTYDWVLTFEQEVELVWRQRWSLMTVLYLGVRYLGISLAVLEIFGNVTTISLTDSVSFIVYAASDWINLVVYVMLWVIIITRLHAMYQRSRKILIFLVVPFLGLSIFCGVAIIMSMMDISGEELILSGIYRCWLNYAGDDVLLLVSLTWILAIAWEVLTLCLAVWIAVKHFRERRRHSVGGIFGDCFTVLMETHVLYFASFVASSCFQLIYELSPVADQYSIDVQIYACLLQIFQVLQMFVLGPRLILSVRAYHAKLVADSDATTDMTSVAFQEHVHISTSSSV